ncbi:MAG: Na(+)-translocating NADH-quinone reductase subunit B, partial [Chlamydiae bacterium]|nr:Na(+)-translocating NADH-quinone reductase subunit B [Chlamydiota bacterium]
MLRKLLDFHLHLTDEGRPLGRLRPLVEALDTFFYEVPTRTSRGPHIRDLIDLKRWMMMVVYALIPCILMAIWNSGVQSFIYGSGSIEIMDSYIIASRSFSGYFAFAGEHFWPIVVKGAAAFLPVMIISYVVGGLWEGLFAIIRRHEISEGFLVTGMLFALILPSTIPYWMVVVGVSAGVVIGKEIFGGTGMNILNPALVCRAFLFFAFPTKMTGPVWVGTNPTTIQKSITSMSKSGADGISQASPLNLFNISSDIKRVHVQALAREATAVIVRQLNFFKAGATIETLSDAELRAFVTAPHG